MIWCLYGPGKLTFTTHYVFVISALMIVVRVFHSVLGLGINNPVWLHCIGYFVVPSQVSMACGIPNEYSQVIAVQICDLFALASVDIGIELEGLPTVIKCLPTSIPLCIDMVVDSVAR